MSPSSKTRTRQRPGSPGDGLPPARPPRREGRVHGDRGRDATGRTLRVADGAGRVLGTLPQVGVQDRRQAQQAVVDALQEPQVQPGQGTDTGTGGARPDLPQGRLQEAQAAETPVPAAGTAPTQVIPPPPTFATPRRRSPGTPEPITVGTASGTRRARRFGKEPRAHHDRDSPHHHRLRRPGGER
ncbi:hypothetical protein GCM10017776_60470 [Streptomyces griseoluteus]|nr:hypothetical protein GCM10017776_60470 [Streptomyces griseoluteus]